MDNKTVSVVKLALALACLVAGTGAVAAGNPFDAARHGAVVLAGEIILVPPRSEASTSETEAARQRETAREYRKGQVAPAPAVIIVPDEEGGVMSPRRTNNGAAENAARARAYRQGDGGNGATPPAVVIPEPPPAAAESTSAQRARSNRARAIEYRRGEQHSGVAVKGGDGLPIIDCGAVDNVAGRIGDDTRSGSVVTLIQDRNQIKVRCR